MLFVCMFELLLKGTFDVIHYLRASLLSQRHAGVEIESLFHHFVSSKRHSHHWNGAEVVDGHAAIKSFDDSIFSVNQLQSAPHADSVREIGARKKVISILYKHDQNQKNQSVSPNLPND